jgi:hypothetical protein
MHTNLYQVEQLDRQHRQQLIEQAAHDRSMSALKTTSSRTIKQIKLVVAAVIVAATLLATAPRALTAQHASVPTVASMCCSRSQS